MHIPPYFFQLLGRAECAIFFGFYGFTKLFKKEMAFNADVCGSNLTGSIKNFINSEIPRS